MGAIAEAFAAYAQPLLDQTDGSLEQLNQALAVAQLCYNLALLPEDERITRLSEMRPALPPMDNAEFDAVVKSVIIPMIQRHEEMFPGLHGRAPATSSQRIAPTQAQPRKSVASKEAYPGTDRYAPCPCHSGEKYKFCCGKKPR